MKAQELGVGSDCPNSYMRYYRCKVCGRPGFCSLGCGSRFDNVCPICAKRWRRKTFSRYNRAVNNMRNPKLMTLTRRKIGSMTKRLTETWTLRKLLFKYLSRKGYRIRSWVAVIEPPNHIHIIADMDYVPQWTIAELWSRLTGDSFIVDIRALNVHRNPRAAAAYITKYLSKASKWEGINLAKLEGFHLIGSWGVGSPPKSIVCTYCGGEKPFTTVNQYDYWAVVHEFGGAYYGNFGLD